MGWKKRWEKDWCGWRSPKEKAVVPKDQKGAAASPPWEPAGSALLLEELSPLLLVAIRSPHACWCHWSYHHTAGATATCRWQRRHWCWWVPSSSWLSVPFCGALADPEGRECGLQTSSPCRSKRMWKGERGTFPPMPLRVTLGMTKEPGNVQDHLMCLSYKGITQCKERSSKL